MEIVVQPEPSDEERAALLEALAAAAHASPATPSEWRRAALLESTEAGEP
jgi:hypothetical protein